MVCVSVVQGTLRKCLHFLLELRECRGNHSAALQAGSLTAATAGSVARSVALSTPHQSCEPTVMIIEQWLSEPSCRVLSILPCQAEDTFGDIA